MMPPSDKRYKFFTAIPTFTNFFVTNPFLFRTQKISNRILSHLQFYRGVFIVI